MITQTSEIKLDANCRIFQRKLPRQLICDTAEFEELWALHPPDFPSIFLHGRQVSLPRWQQAYGVSYFFSGQTSQAKTVPECLQAYLLWAQQHHDPRLNGLLLNWYDARMGHYIGAHRDSAKGLLKGSDIIMISLGGSRVMRFRPMAGSGFFDVEVNNGDAIIMPLDTNQHFKHEIPVLKRYQDRRISITLRCFEPA